MRVIGLCGLTGCGAAIYFPVEPPPFDTDPPMVDTDTVPDTDLPPDTDLSPDTDLPTTPSTPTSGGLPCSFYGFFGADIHILNPGTQPVYLYWRDFYCAEHYYGQIPPEDDWEQGSYDHQAWVVRDAVGVVIDSLVVDEAYELWELP